MMEHDLVILASGGYDSTLLCHMAKKMDFEPIALSIDYGQKHVRELESAKKSCAKLKIPCKRMTIDFGGAIDSALTGDLESGKYAGVSEFHVPGRNTIFTGLALSLAETVGAKKIWYGANGEDRLNNFADCTQEWVYAMNLALKRAGSYPIELEAPLLGRRPG